MSARFQTYTPFTTASIAAGVTTPFDKTGLPSLFNICKLKVTPDTAGGSFDVKIFKKDTYLAADLLVWWDNVTTALYFPMDDSTGAPAEALEGPSIPYDDSDNTGELHLQITNNDGSAHTYTVTLEYEEVPKFDSSGNATFRAGIVATTGTFSGSVAINNTGSVFSIGTAANSATYLLATLNSGATQAIFGVDSSASGTGFAGTLTNKPFVIRVNNAEVARFDTSSLAIGTNPATVGAIRIPNGDGVQSRNAANSANAILMYLNSSNQLVIGGDSTTVGILINGSSADTDVSIASDANANHFVSDAGAFSAVGAISFGDTAHVATPFYINQPALTSTAGQAFARVWIRSANAVTIGAGTASVVSGLTVDEPNITLGGNTVTDAYSLVISNAPTEATRNGGLWVASGETRFDGTLLIAAGASTRSTTVGGTLNINTTAVGNVGGGTDTLITYTLPANVLNATARTIRVYAWGTTANNANAKTLTLDVGSQTVMTQALTTSIAGTWRIEALVCRNGSNTQDIFAELLQLATIIHKQTLTAGTQTDTATIVIKCTGAATTDNDIVQEGMIVEVLN